VEDVVEARHHQQHAFLQRQRTAGQTGARATGDDGYLALMAEAKHALDFLDVTRQHHQHGRGAVGGEPVAFVRFERFALMEDFQVGKLGLQGLEQCIFVHVRQDAVDAFIVENVHGSQATLKLFLFEVCSDTADLHHWSVAFYCPCVVGLVEPVLRPCSFWLFENSMKNQRAIAVFGHLWIR
jgi:hypothetical protein